MKYKFPHINHIDQIREAIKDRREFNVIEKDDYLVVNYFVNLIDSFPSPYTKDEKLNEHYMLRRECRGILFCAKTGKVLARRYHKFFNLGEKDETHIQKIDLTDPHIILEKLDGSMITPFISNGILCWGTKMGVTDIGKQVNSFVDNNPHYETWVKNVMANNMTPIFEWCSRKQKIVIDYPVDRLVLTAVRHNVTGEYLSYEDMKKAESMQIDVVKALSGSITNLQQFLNETKDLKDAEGYVIRFDDGHMLKIKAEEYLRVHKAKDSLRFEKDILGYILRETIDDIKAVLTDEERARIDEYQNKVLKGLLNKAEELKWIVIAGQDNFNSKKDFALKVVQNHMNYNERGLLFKIWDGQDPYKVVHDFALAHTSTQTKVDEIRGLIGNADWNVDSLSISDD